MVEVELLVGWFSVTAPILATEAECSDSGSTGTALLKNCATRARLQSVVRPLQSTSSLAPTHGNISSPFAFDSLRSFGRQADLIKRQIVERIGFLCACLRNADDDLGCQLEDF